MAVGLVAHRPAFHDVPRIVVEMRVRHTERLEDALVRKLTQRFARDALDDLGQQEVAGVAVEVVVTRLEVELLLPGDERNGLGIGEHIFDAQPTERHQSVDVANAARVMNEVVDGYRRPIVWHLLDVCPDVVSERDLAVEYEEANTRG